MSIPFRPPFTAIAPLLAAAAAALTGCPNVANLTTARVLPEGTAELTLAPAVTGISLAIFDAEETGTLTAGTIDIGARVGLAEPVDLGVRVSNMGNFNLDVKVSLLDNDALRVALDPTIGGVFFGGKADAGYIQADLPVLFDVALGERVTFSIAPRYSLLYFFAGNATTPASHLLGGAIGIEIALGDSFAFQPNFGMAVWANGPSEVETFFFSGGVAFKFMLGGSRFGPTADATAALGR